jgi:uncharacterized protein YjgD (DUF1641 family)
MSKEKTRVLEQAKEEFFKNMGFENIHDVPDMQIEQLTTAFYSGCAFMFTHMMDNVSALPDDQAFEAINGINQEIVDFGKTLKIEKS